LKFWYPVTQSDHFKSSSTQSQINKRWLTSSELLVCTWWSPTLCSRQLIACENTSARLRRLAGSNRIRGKRSWSPFRFPKNCFEEGVFRFFDFSCIFFCTNQTHCKQISVKINLFFVNYRLIQDSWVKFWKE
jgi:hypothetical protein